MIQCKNCGRSLPDYAKFCASCGAPVGDVRRAPVENVRRAPVGNFRPAAHAVPAFTAVDWHLLKPRLIALALVAASLILLSFSWAVPTGDTKHEWREHQGEVQEALYYLSHALAWSEYSADLGGMEKVSAALADGRVSASEMFTVSKELLPLLNRLDEYDRDKYTNGAMVIFLLYLIAYGATILCGLGSIVLLVMDHPKRFAVQGCYAFSLFCILALFCVLCAALASEDIGLDFRPTVPSVLALILAWPRNL